MVVGLSEFGLSGFCRQDSRSAVYGISLKNIAPYSPIDSDDTLPRHRLRV